MSQRPVRSVALLALFGAVALAAPQDAPKPQETRARAEPRRADPASLLSKTATFNGFDDPKLTLQQALDVIGERYGVAIDVNEEAFRQRDLPDAAALPVAEKPLRRMPGATLDRVLTRVLARLPVPAAYLIRGDVIEVTTLAALRAEIWGNYQGPYLPLVHAAFEGRPLAEALREVAAQSGLNVVLDGRCADQGKTPVTARFVNTPADTAARLLADMAELRPFLVDNTIYVTAKENADEMEQREKARVNDDGGMPRVGHGPRAAAGTGPGV